MKLMFSAINCTLDSSNGAAISIRTFLKFLSRYGVECRSFSASVYDRPEPGSAIDNLIATGALPVEEPGLPQTLWLQVDEGVYHYILHSRAMTQHDMTVADEQVLFNRALALLDAYQPDVLLLYGNRRYERSLLKKARERGIATVFYLVNPEYRDIKTFEHVDMVFTDSQATKALFDTRFGFDCKVIGKFIEKPAPPPAAPSPQYVTFINPSAEKGVTLFLRIVELAAQILPEAQFLVVENRSTLAAAQERTGLFYIAHGNVKRLGLQREMGAVYSATRVLLVPSLWHDSGPRVAVEAQAFGIPSVVSDRGGLPELVGEAGVVIAPPEPLVEDYWLVPPLTQAIPWVEAIRILLSDDETYDHYRLAAFEKWSQHDPAKRLPGIVADLETLVASKSAKFIHG